MEKQNEYKKLYIQESGEFLQEMNKNLLIIEKDPKNTDALNTIFRSAHTLKSMSASMGYSLIADLSHKMEDVLSQARDNTLQISEELVNLLFESFDSLESMVRDVQEEKEIKKDIQPLVNKLDKAMTKRIKFNEEKVTDEISLNEFEKKTLARVKSEGFQSYYIKIYLEKNCVLKSVRAFMIFRNLHNIGEVIKSIPSSQDLEEEKFGESFSCIFVTKEKKDIVEKNVFEILDVEKVIVNEIQINPLWNKDVKQSSIDDTKEIKEAAGQSGQMRKIQSVRVDIKRLDKLMNLVEELAISKLRLLEIGLRFQDNDLKSVIEDFNRHIDDLQMEVMQARLVPVNQIFERFPRLVRDLAKRESKLIKFDVTGGDIELDRSVLDEIGDSLIHLLKNSVDHGIESPQVRKNKGKQEEGTIVLSARREKSYVLIEVKDDGKGIDTDVIKKIAIERGIIKEEDLKSMNKEDILLLTAHPGLSTKQEVTDISGRGVGLDVVKQKTESLGGSVVIESDVGLGAKITMRLPITTAVVQALMVVILQKTFAIPISSVIEILVAKENDIKKIEASETILHRNKVLPIIRLENLFSLVCDMNSDSRTAAHNSLIKIVIVEFENKQFGIVVDKLLSQQDIVIKQLSKEFKGIHGFAGATILGDGKVALILDVATLI
ncbi:MAG: chemotaxis protein CheA [bacterium]|nr:chemotaxis protein CheA [bacterium]